MTNTEYTATKTRSNRPGWTIIFKHPMRSDGRGRKGLKIRKGLSTRDEQQADEMVAEMNQLLSDKRWWSIDRRSEAELSFSPIIVDAFYNGMEAGKVDAMAQREAMIPLPGPEEEYAKVMFTGTSGAGKTTLVRHLIGCDHKNDRFPSTSTARTTTAEIEIICAEGDFSGAVTFMPEHEARAHIEECIEEACSEVVSGADDEKVMGKLLTHREQRFRLSYILGHWQLAQSDNTEDDDDDFDFDDNNSASPVDELTSEEGVSQEERAAHQQLLTSYREKIQKITEKVETALDKELGKLCTQNNQEDKASWLELFRDNLYKNEEFATLALDILDELRGKFDGVQAGTFEKDADSWPLAWSLNTADRADFLKQIRWFSSNHHGQFGKLLTPLVNGVRIKAPLFPDSSISTENTKLVLFDGEGIGHSAKNSSSISTKVTRKFKEMDLILLVDNAEQPMMRAPMELLRALGSSGHASKLAVAFTHFDLVKGANLGNSFPLKKEHVLGAARDALGTLRESIGASATHTLEAQLDSRSFFLGGLDRESCEIPGGFRKQISSLIGAVAQSRQRRALSEAGPIYSSEGLETALRDAIYAFLEPWKARLGVSYHDGISKEHWGRVKALTRRFAMQWSNEYHDLKPVADLVARLSESISKWLDNPLDWANASASDEAKAASLAAVRQDVFQALHDLAESRLGESHQSAWKQAFEFSGGGSATLRANGVKEIYEDAAPPISSVMSPSGRDFLHLLNRIIRDSVVQYDGKFQSM